jgi:O-antigen/teichoic acid export membrane protein
VSWRRRLRALSPAAAPLAFGQLLRIALAFLTTTLVVHIASPEDAGRFFVGLAATRFVSPLVSLGGADAALRLSAAGASPAATVRKLSPWSLVLAAVVAAVAGFVLQGLAPGPGWFAAYVGLVFLLSISFALRTWLNAGLVAAGRITEAGAHEVVRGSGPLVGVALAALTDGGGPALVWGYGVGTLAASATLLAWVGFTESGAGTPVLDTDRDLRHSFSVALGATLRAGYESSDQLLLPIFVSLAVVRDYGLAASLTYACMAGVAAAGELRVPEMYSGRDAQQASERSRRPMLAVGAAMYAVAVAVAVTLAWWFRAPLIAWIALVLGAVLPLRALAYVPLAALTAGRQQRRRNLIEAQGGIGNVIMNFALMPLIGPFGAAVTSVGAEAWMAHRSRRMLGRVGD